MTNCSCFDYRNKVQVSIHYSWLSSPIMWIARILSLVLLLARLGLYYDQSKCCAQSFIYLTFYGFTLSLAYYITVAIHLPIQKLLFKQSKVVRVIGECINMLYEATFAIEFMLTLLFWSLLAEGDDLWTFDNLGMHLIPFLLLIVDFIFNSYAFPIRHLILTFVLGAIYLTINQIHSCNETPVYNVYQCGNIWLPVVAFMLLAIIHLFGHLLWKKWRINKIGSDVKIDQCEQSLLNT